MTEKILVEKKDWQYYLYRSGENYQLLVPVPEPAPGFDVFHDLTEYERSSFLKSGISSLQERIVDMNKNISNYKLNSWR